MLNEWLRHAGGKPKNAFRHPARGSLLDVRVRLAEKRSARRSRVGRWSGALLAAAALAALSTTVLRAFGRAVFADNPRYAIQSFDIRSDGRLTADLIRRYAGLEEGMNLFAVDLRALREGLMSIPAVREATVERRPPGTLAIRISERIPLARVAAGDGGMELAVDREGVLLGPSYASPHLPRIAGAGLSTLRPGDRIAREDLLDAVRLLDVCDSTRLGQIVRITSVRLMDRDSLILELAEGDRVLFPRGQMDQKLRRLAAILQSIRDSGRRAPGRRLEIDMTPDANHPVTGLLE